MENTNLMKMLEDVNIDKLGNTLKEIEKYEKLLDKISGLIMRLNRIGVLPAVLRIIGKKADVTNIEAPLPQISPLSFEAASSTHLLLYKQLNEQPEQVIIEMLKQAILVEEREKTKRRGKKRKKEEIEEKEEDEQNNN